jgi:hypothetical protein
LLSSQLLQAHRGEKPLLHAIAEYEASMREYAFSAVADSLKAMMQFTGEKKNPPFRSLRPVCAWSMPCRS